MFDSRARLRRMEQILAISHEFTSTLSLEAILHRIVRVAANLVDCESVGILLWDEQANDLRFVAATLFHDQLLNIPVPIDTSIAGAAFTSAQPVIVNQVARDPRYYARVGEMTGLPAHSLLAVPLQFRNRKIGVLEAENKRYRRKFDAQDVEMLTALAIQMTIAIENARLYEQAQREIVARVRAEDALRQQRDQLEIRVAERTRDLAALYDVSAIATRAHELEPLLRESLARTMAALECTVGAILLVREKHSPAETTQLRLVAHQGFSPAVPIAHEMTATANGLFAQMGVERQPVLIPDVSTDPRVPTKMRALGACALLIAPLHTDDQVWGLIGLLREPARIFSADQIALLAAIARQLGVAVQSHHLRQSAQQSVLLGERQRLARDLHDSVTQALYGVTLFAQASRSSIHTGNLALTGQYIERLSESARQALKEMRLLIFELRPSLLDQIGFVGALQQRLEAVERRAGVAIEFKVEGLTELPAAIENDVYYIAQEALNNILKHSGAVWVALRLTIKERVLYLDIQDDGRGFDAAKTSTTAGIGFASMRERVARLGGELRINSKPGAGTRIALAVPIREDE